MKLFWWTMQSLGYTWLLGFVAFLFGFFVGVVTPDDGWAAWRIGLLVGTITWGMLIVFTGLWAAMDQPWKKYRR